MVELRNEQDCHRQIEEEIFSLNSSDIEEILRSICCPPDDYTFFYNDFDLSL